MLTRRSFLVTPIALGFIPSQSKAEQTWQDMLAAAIANKDPLTLGRIIPPIDSPLWDEADICLSQAVENNKRTYDIAEYFVTSLPEKFQIAWPEPNPARPTLANPVIVRFFLATNTRPSGDKTAWCAAFVNWCLMYTRRTLPETNSAAARSFLNWGDEVWRRGQSWPPSNAKRGDIAVFRLMSDPKHGHVGFYHGPTANQPDHIDILGGNQFDEWGHHTFSIRTFNINAGLRLVTIRTAEGLR